MSLSVTDICNLALQKVGAAKITSINDSTPSARACLTCYENERKSLLRRYAWKFAIKLVQLSADATAPAFGKSASFTLPADYISILPPHDSENFDHVDWVVQGGKIYSNNTDELDLRYIYDVTTTGLMDPLFIEALSARMALQMVEVLTQSNVKKADLFVYVKDAIAEAKRANSFETVNIASPDTGWFTIRDT